MTPSGSKASSICGEGVSSDEDSKTSLISGAGVSPGEDSEAFPISGEGGSAEEEYTENRNLIACSAPKSKRLRRPSTGTSSLGTNLDVGMWGMLDDHLLEKIFARLPFKSLFQVSSLSKSWRLRINSRSFQREVHNSSSAFSWNSYAPLFVNHEKDLMGYESGSKMWHKLPPHTYLERGVVLDWSLRAGVGSLLCWVCPNANDWDVFHVHVTNPLTRSWKQLPPRPKMHFPEIVHVGWEDGVKAYKVVVGTLRKRKTLNGRACMRVQIFDSRDDSWTMESYKSVTNCALDWGGSAFINGVLYVLLSTSEWSATYTLISFDVKKNIWNEIPYLCLVIDDDQKPHQLLKLSALAFSQVFVVGSNVLLVVAQTGEWSNMHFGPDDSSNHEEAFGISIFRLNLELGLAFEVSRAPDEMLSVLGVSLIRAAGHNNCIFIGSDYHASSCILYDVQSREWHWVNSVLGVGGACKDRWRWTSTVEYQPGLNPFLEV